MPIWWAYMYYLTTTVLISHCTESDSCSEYAYFNQYGSICNPTFSTGAQSNVLILEEKLPVLSIFERWQSMCSSYYLHDSLGLLWSCSQIVAGAGVIWMPDRNGCSVWLVIDGWSSGRTSAGAINLKRLLRPLHVA